MKYRCNIDKYINSRGRYFLPYCDTFWESNKIKEVSFRKFHNICPINSPISKYCDIDNTCCFCRLSKETPDNSFSNCNNVN